MSKTPAKVSRQTLQQAIENCENGKTYDTQGDLWTAVSSEYDRLTGNKLSPSLIYLRVREWKLSVRTVSGRAKAKAIDPKMLQKCIEDVEAKGVQPNRTELFKQVAVLVKERSGVSTSHSTLGNLAQKFKLTMQTPVGKRGGKGRPGGFGTGPRGPRKTRAEKFSANPETKQSLAVIMRTTPERFQPVVVQITKGSMRAAVKLKCLDCCCWETTEIRKCVVKECSLWPFRPYQGVVESDKPDDEIESDNLDGEESEDAS